jgi:hypothetical protein
MEMRMVTKIQGIPCEVSVAYYPGLPFRQTGMGFGDCEPEEPEEFEIVGVFSRDGSAAPWLARKITESDENRIFEQFKLEKENDNY